MDASTDLKPESSEECARADLAEHGRRSVRVLAKAWNWHRSRVSRFLARLEAETPSETPSLFSETEAETAETPPAPPWRVGDGTDDDRFAWAPENEDVGTNGSMALAIYINPWGNIVLRGDCSGDPCCAHDAVIVINPCDVDIIVERLRVLADEADKLRWQRAEVGVQRSSKGRDGSG
jgi:hypothetical protein